MLKELAYWIDDRRKQVNKEPYRKRKWIQFVKGGNKGKPSVATVESYLSTARDWKLETDLERRLKVPAHIVETCLRPDMILTSECTKQVGFIESTVPTEDRLEISHELKRGKYEELAEGSRRNGWRATIWPVEVGCRGFAARSLTQLLKDIGYRGRQKKNIIKKVEEVAENSTHAIWNWSHSKKWGTHA